MQLYLSQTNKLLFNFNSDKITDKNEGKEYTEVFHAEDVPDSSNEFITDFLDPEGKGYVSLAEDITIATTYDCKGKNVYIYG